MADPHSTPEREVVPECERCDELRQLTREGKARTYSIELSGVFQMETGRQDEITDVLFDSLHCFTGGATVVELPEDEQLTYEEAPR